MPLSKPQLMDTPFEPLWEMNRECARRSLISLTRDIDLADDLLQETYLRARDGFDGYRGGDARAWLVAIAKNVFYAHARRKYFGSEVSLDSESAAQGDLPGSNRHIALMSLRQAISDLPEALRQALLMKHYGGFTYSEIAQRLGCPMGTAQQRVFTAIRRLREALGALREELADMKCGELSGKKLVDYVYGKLNLEDMAGVRKHLEKCPKCRREVDETVEVLRALDADEPSWKLSMIMEPHILYLTFETRCDTGGRGDCVFDFNLAPCVITYAAMNGEEVSIEGPSQDEHSPERYVAHLPREVEAGEMIQMLFVCMLPNGHPLAETDLPFHGGVVCPKDVVYVIALRLPDGATQIEPSPEPTETRTNGRTTVYYRGFLPAGQEFKYSVEYNQPADIC